MHYRELKRMLKAEFPMATFSGHGKKIEWLRTQFGKMPKTVVSPPTWLKMDTVPGVPRVRVLLDKQGEVCLDVVEFNSTLKGLDSAEGLISTLRGIADERRR